METKKSYTGLMHAGASTALAVMQMSAIIPGFLPCLILAGAFLAIVVVPLLVLGLAIALLVAPFAGAWWGIGRLRT